MHGASGFLEIAALLIGGAFVLVTLCVRFGVPGIVGYLLAGVIIGPSGAGLIEEGAALSVIGELGIILLLFTLGLEFSYSKLYALKRLILGVGAAQVLLTTGLVALALTFVFDVAAVPAVLLGGAVAMSSTALTIKVLAGANALGSPEGRVAIAVLLFQDLAAVGLLIFHDTASGSGNGHGLITLLVGTAALVSALIVARLPLQRLTAWIAQQGDSEISQLMALTIALTSAIGAIAMGLSPALGAFAAGMVISESDARHVVEKEIRPFRDLFIGIFFISIGTQLQLEGLFSSWSSVLAWLAVLIPLKLIINVALIRWFGDPTPTAFQAAAILAHGGEFGLALVSVAMASGMIGSDFGNPLLLALGFSMLCASIIIKGAIGHGRGRVE